MGYAVLYNVLSDHYKHTMGTEGTSCVCAYTHTHTHTHTHSHSHTHSHTLHACHSQGEILETVTTACVCLFTHQPTLADQVPPLGHIPRILGRMKATNDAIPRSCAMVVHVLADSDVSSSNLVMAHVYTVDLSNYRAP